MSPSKYELAGIDQQRAHGNRLEMKLDLDKQSIHLERSKRTTLDQKEPTRNKQTNKKPYFAYLLSASYRS